MLRSLRIGMVLALAVDLVACEAPPAVQVTHFDLRVARRAFLDIPWPCDFDRRDDGQLDLRSFPNPTGSTTLEDYIYLAEELDGFALNGSIYLGVGAALDPATLPTPRRSYQQEDAGLQLLDVDPASPELGRRFPVSTRSYQGDLFVPDGGLAVWPQLGFPLRPATTYAVVLTRGVHTMDGVPLAPSPDLVAVLAAEEPILTEFRTAHALFAPLRTRWQEEGRALDEIALATIFTTRDPTRPLELAAADLRRRNSAAVEELTEATDLDQHEDYLVFEGWITLDQFQRGTPPYVHYGSGGLVEDDGGLPLVQRRERLPFALTVPRGAPPASGWPVALVAHGTGGWWRGFIGDRDGDEATFLARAGWAGLGISQPLHLDREGYREGMEDVNTFNFFNPVAGVGNWQQSALETVALARWLRDGVLPRTTGGRELPLDGARIGLFGHSQGGLSGAIALGVDQDIRLAVLSGAGGGFAASLIKKSEPFSPEATIRTMLSLPDDEEIDLFHPVLTLLQLIAEEAEPLNFVSRIHDAARGRSPVSIFITSGLVDSYTPVLNHGPLAVALGAPAVEPLLDPIAAYEVAEMAPVPAPLQGNITTADGPATAGLAQFLAPEGVDGHFVVYYNRMATQAVQRFFATGLYGPPVLDPRLP